MNYRPHARRDATDATASGVGLAAVVLVAFNLRGSISSVGPLLGEIQEKFGLNAANVAILTSAPLVCFGALAPLAPSLARRLGIHRAVLLALVTLSAGIALRLLGVAGLYAGTILVGAGIAVMNVLLPALLRLDLSHRLGLAAGLTTSAMMLSATLGAGLALPLTVPGGGAIGSLALWLTPSSVAIVVWFAAGGARRRPPAGMNAPRGVFSLLRDPTGRAVTLFFGLQSLVFYTVLTWLPRLLQDQSGLTAAHAGAALALACAVGVPAGVVVPRIASATPDQQSLIVLLSIPTIVGLSGLLLLPSTAPWAWATLVGLGNGCSFPLAISLIVLRSKDDNQAARLSAAAQGVGYLLAAIGPVAVGLLWQRTDSWNLCLALLLGAVVAQIVCGLPAARHASKVVG